MNAKAQDVILASDSLTQKQEDFARYYVEYRNATTAYRQAYDVGANTKPVTVHRSATALLAHPDVAARIEELRDLAESKTVMRARELLGDLLDIATADPNELIRHTRVNCRHCRGIGHAYQWQDAEWSYKAAEAMSHDPPLPAPREDGGFGYDPTLPPVPSCPQCYGQGVAVVDVANTNELTGKARKLYKGIEMKADGSLKILMHDQADARKELAKIFGIYADGKGRGIDLTAAPAELSQSATAEDASIAYLEMVK
jgi:phage terminase small subunit